MSDSAPHEEAKDMVTKRSPRSVSETVSRFTESLKARDIQVFAVIDQRAEAHRVGLELRETTLVIFGSPAQRALRRTA